MVNKPGKIVATAPNPGATSGGDNSLPDPSAYARISLLVLVLIACGLAIALNDLHWTTVAFKPPKLTGTSFGLFAGFYAAAQVIERALELISPLLPPTWLELTTSGNAAVKAAQIKADRGLLTLGVAAVLGVGMSCGLGLYFLGTIGMHASHTVDSLLTGITIAAGTKPLHDFISLIQNQSTPKTGTGA
jgi:hypothetical protein